MKNIKISILSFIFLIAFGGCSDWLDVNENPNYISELQAPEVVVPVAQVNVANALMGWDMGFAGAFWSQYWTQNYTASQFKFLDEYTETDFDYAYTNLLPGALNDFNKVLSLTEEGSGEYLIAEVMSIYAWQIVTDTWGDMPYFDALKGEEGVFSPAFDEQELIYADLLARIDLILAGDYSEAVFNADYDFVYEGDITNWLAFAKSLKLKLMLRLSETSSYDNSALIALINEGGLLTETAMIPGYIWEDKDGKQHPMVEFEASGAGYLATNVIASRSMIAYLQDVTGDARIDALFTSGTAGHKGSLQGDFASQEDADGNGIPEDEEMDTYSTVSFEADADIPLMSVWEVNFYIAEVYARAGNSANAKTYYDAAVQASCDYWGVANNVTIVGGGAEYPSSADLEVNLEAIALQKWVSYCKLQHIEAFCERNRLKYPSINTVNVAQDRLEVYANFPEGEFTLAVEGRALLSEKVPSSPIYPNAVITRNATNPSQKINLAEKVWWDQKTDIYN